MSRTGLRLAAVFLLVAALPPAGGCVRRHRNLVIQSDRRPGRIPLAASWRGLSFKRFSVKGMDAKSYFATLEGTPKAELERALLTNLHQSGVFNSIERGAYESHVEVAAEVRRFDIETTVSTLSGVPCLGMAAMASHQVKYKADIEIALQVSPVGRPDHDLAVAVGHYRDSYSLNLTKKQRMARAVADTLGRVTDRLKDDLVRKRAELMAALGPNARRRAVVAPQARRAPTPRPRPAPAVAPMTMACCDPRTIPFAQPPARRLTLAVLDLRNMAKSKELTLVVTDLVRSTLVRSGHFKVLDRAHMEAVLAEQSFSVSDCASAECVVELGQLLSAEMLVTGKVVRLGKLWSVNIQLLNVSTGEVIAAADQACQCDEGGLLALARCAARELVSR